uniref:Ribosomal protein L32 n=2 Tax=Erodium TaxID=21555 RepID=B7T2T5_9ROSI|nr:ribosomal protein L32 [Erodium absinthoides]YP_009131193.1 ribosomal protein L32 [Erodium absinthoides]YP_009138235.1 ribosomal protein L32 [Erodium chrysanthum]YP_009138273.1 ribosomal protein L32 [Erodium chrysanthum]ACH47384.1 ribosomal protein L32 [Erodium chrysanthum]AIA26363.1 ribosomal protein L32 [Erodium absinthoides]AIA26406.1 ribosomal protein L32 [Erodium absinthoides]AIA81368.1 ribosomal protein L32 [Erodium chrysanthum]AIA81406.1 ribosomal protein L32 [Erodium chrysanthum]
MALPKKRRSSSKRKIRQNVWKAQASSAALKSISLGKSFLIRGFILFNNNRIFSRFSDPHKTRRKPRGFVSRRGI